MVGITKGKLLTDLYLTVKCNYRRILVMKNLAINLQIKFVDYYLRIYRWKNLPPRYPSI